MSTETHILLHGFGAEIGIAAAKEGGTSEAASSTLANGNDAVHSLLAFGPIAGAFELMILEDDVYPDEELRFGWPPASSARSVNSVPEIAWTPSLSRRLDVTFWSGMLMRYKVPTSAGKVHVRDLVFEYVDVGPYKLSTGLFCAGERLQADWLAKSPDRLAVHIGNKHIDFEVSDEQLGKELRAVNQNERISVAEIVFPHEARYLHGWKYWDRAAAQASEPQWMEWVPNPKPAPTLRLIRN